MNQWDIPRRQIDAEEEKREIEASDAAFDRLDCEIAAAELATKDVLWADRPQSPPLLPLVIDPRPLPERHSQEI